MIGNNYKLSEVASILELADKELEALISRGLLPVSQIQRRITVVNKWRLEKFKREWPMIRPVFLAEMREEDRYEILKKEHVFEKLEAPFEYISKLSSFNFSNEQDKLSFMPGEVVSFLKLKYDPPLMHIQTRTGKQAYKMTQDIAVSFIEWVYNIRKQVEIDGLIEGAKVKKVNAIKFTPGQLYRDLSLPRYELPVIDPSPEVPISQEPERLTIKQIEAEDVTIDNPVITGMEITQANDGTPEIMADIKGITKKEEKPKRKRTRKSKKEKA